VVLVMRFDGKDTLCCVKYLGNRDQMQWKGETSRKLKQTFFWDRRRKKPWSTLPPAKDSWGNSNAPCRRIHGHGGFPILQQPFESARKKGPAVWVWAVLGADASVKLRVDNRFFGFGPTLVGALQAGTTNMVIFSLQMSEIYIWLYLSSVYYVMRYAC
jgi:hypothetical protein